MTVSQTGKMSWYKRNPNDALGGMMCLTLEERGAYNTVLDLIYSHQGKLIDDDYFIAGWCRCDVRVWKRIKKTLVEKGKITVVDGLVSNFRATSELSHAVSVKDSATDNGRSGGLKSGAKRSKNKHLREAECEAKHEAETKLNKSIELREDDNKLSSSSEDVLEKENQPQKQDPSKLQNQDEFEKFSQALFAIEGVSAHPIAANPVIAPIWQISKNGLDLKTQIIPSIKRQIATAKGKIRSWGYFADGILGDNSPQQSPQPQSVTEFDWQERIGFGRRNHQWSTAKWGPIPGQEGCKVPKHLLEPSDGNGWTEWKSAA